MTIPATTTRALKTSIRNAIAACTPRIQIKGAEKWTPFDRSPGGVAGTRHFSIVMAAGQPTPGGLWGLGYYDCTAELIVLTSYAVPEQDMEIMEDDLHQLREVVLSLRGTTGIIHCQVIGTQNEDTASDDAVIVTHRLEIRYMRSTEVN